jgi:hypothetical protein
MWKIMLATLGGHKEAAELKSRKRRAAGLAPVEDTFLAACRMPPLNLELNAYQAAQGFQNNSGLSF